MSSLANRPVVIDTNIWLDILVFGDEQARRLSEQIQTLNRHAGLSIASSESVRTELRQVLERPFVRLNETEQSRCLDRYDALVQAYTLPELSMTRLQCRDRADQKFLELATCSGAQALLTRDKALLRLAKRARREHHFDILDSPAWLERMHNAT